MSKRKLKSKPVWVARGHAASWGSAKTSLTFVTSVCFHGWSYYSSFHLSSLSYQNRRTNACHQNAQQYFLKTAFLSYASSHVLGSGTHDGFLINRVNKHPLLSGWASLPWGPLGLVHVCLEGLYSCPSFQRKMPSAGTTVSKRQQQPSLLPLVIVHKPNNGAITNGKQYGKVIKCMSLCFKFQLQYLLLVDPGQVN